MVNFLNYVGCGDLKSGYPDYAYPFGSMRSALDKGWIAQVITSDNMNNLPLGIIASQHGKHAITSVGNGKIFESGGGSGGGGGGGATIDAFASCAGSWQNAVAHPENCRACAKLTGHEPFATSFKGGPPYNSSGCNSTQFWTLRSMRRQLLNDIIVAPAQNFAAVGFKVVNNPIPVQVNVSKNAGWKQMSLDPAVCDDMGVDCKRM
jgi:hypothetical protein